MLEEERLQQGCRVQPRPILQEEQEDVNEEDDWMSRMDNEIVNTEQHGGCKEHKSRRQKRKAREEYRQGVR